METRTWLKVTYKDKEREPEKIEDVINYSDGDVWLCIIHDLGTRWIAMDSILWYETNEL